MSSAQGIGGYYELALHQYGTVYHDDAYKFQSARAAFRALLQEIKPKKVWIPKFTCDAMLTPLKKEGVIYAWYDLDLDLAVLDDIKLKDNEFILYVNYFGLCDHNVEKILKIFPHDRVILDFSQAFFSKKREEALATIYSPRKFFAVPDGGMLVTKVSIQLPDNQDEGSLDRMNHLLKRLYAPPEEGYSDYKYSELSLSDCRPLQMSRLTERLLQSINYESAKKVRHDNFVFLKNELENYNIFNFMDEEGYISPLCYPLLTKNNSNLKEILIKNRVFIPTYWDDAITRVKAKWAEQMIVRLAPIPIDQRYDLHDMRIIVDLVKEQEHG